MSKSGDSFFFRERGFSLVDMMVLVSLIGVVAMIAAQSYPELRASFARNNARQELEFALVRARSEALARGARTIVEVQAGGQALAIGFDHFPYAEVPEIEQLVATYPLPASIFVVPDRQIIFDSRGVLVDSDGELNNVQIELKQAATTFLTQTLFPVGNVFDP